MSFQFVENNNIDEAARKRIRSHVMKGKNAGKVRPRNRQKQGAKHIPSHDDRKPTDKNDELGVLSVPRAVGDIFSTLTFPCELKPYMKDLLHKFWSMTHSASYPEEFCLPVNSMKLIWFRYFQTDESFFHCSLAMGEMAAGAMLVTDDASPRVLHHLTNAYRCIQRNLQTQTIPSDETVASIMSIAIHEDLKGHPERSKIHMDALWQIVQIRGGISKLRNNRALCTKVCRADIEYTLHEGLYPRFYVDDFPHEVIRSPLYQVVDQNELLNLLDSSHVFDPELRSIIADLIRVCRFFNVDRKDFNLLEPYAFQEIWISLSYRLLHHYPLRGGQRETASENAWQFSILAFITTFLFQKGRSLRLSYSLLAGSLRKAIDCTLANDSIAESTMLWFLFVGGISVFDSPDTVWLSPKVKTSLANLGIDNWLAARDEIKKHPWIDVIHDKLGEELWHSIFGQ